MSNKIDVPDEDLQWLLENPISDSPGLFSKSPTWFKHSAYEIKEVRGNLYICPTLGATLTQYKPFEKFPKIMADLIELLVKLDEQQEKDNNEREKLCKSEQYKNMSEEDHIKRLKRAEMERAKLLLSFISKYGLFGIMYEYIESLEPCRQNGEDDWDNIIVSLDKKAYGGLSLYIRNKMLDSYTEEGIFNFSPMIKYNDLSSYFLPNVKEPYPEIKSKDFRKNYSEKVNDIILNRNITFLKMHIKKMNEYISKSYTPNDKVPEKIYSNGFRKISIEWSTYLAQSFGDIGLTFSYDKDTNKWDLNWNFKSLLGALSIMYLMNITGRMGSHVHICKYSKCNKVVIDRNCCCERHDNAYRKAKERAKKVHFTDQ